MTYESLYFVDEHRRLEQPKDTCWTDRTITNLTCFSSLLFVLGNGYGKMRKNANLLWMLPVRDTDELIRMCVLLHPYIKAQGM